MRDIDARSRLGLVWLAVALGVAGCPGDDDGDDDVPGDDDVSGDDDTSGAETGCGFVDEPAIASVEVAQRQVSGTDDDWRGVIGGRVREHAEPQMYDTFLAEGDCRFLQVDYGHCDPPCEHDELCTPDGSCVGYPAGIGAGTLTVDVAGAVYVIDGQGYDPGLYTSTETLPDALFAAGDAVTASFSGDQFPAVSLAARGVARLETPLGQTGLTLTPGEDAVLSWTPGPEPDACVRVQLLGTNRGFGHGAPINALVWCETTDTGELIVPAQMAAWMVLEGPFNTICVGHDCPPSEIERYTRAAADPAGGRAELRVATRSTFWLATE